MKENNNTVHNAIGYIRISIKDQSSYSLPYQDKTIREYCHRNTLNLINIYKDDGEHSDTFDRPDWRALERFIKQHKGKVKFLIVIDYDRFSRDLAEALLKIKELEMKFGVKILSTSEHIDTDTQDPTTFMMRAFKLMIANHELINIRRRTKNGIRTALESGRVVNRAPFGYKNARDAHDKPIIVIDKVRASIIRQVFDDALNGYSIKEITRRAKENGFTIHGRSAIIRVLSNSIYAGLIKVPAMNGQPGKMVKAMHEPLISSTLFWQVQEIISNRSKPHYIPTDVMPLRGILRCSCGTPLTGGFSKGRSKYYLYYRCRTKGHAHYTAKDLHKTFDELLDLLSFTPDQLDYVAKSARSSMQDAIKARSALLLKKQNELASLTKKIDNLEEKLITGEIDMALFRKWSGKLATEKGILQLEVESLTTEKEGYFDRLDEALPVLCDLKVLFKNLEVESQHILIKEWFKGSPTFNGAKFRTAFLHPAFDHNRLKIKENGLLEVEQSIENLEEIQQCSEIGS